MKSCAKVLRVIIPAAGYGLRMGAPMSKEMFCLDGKVPLIERALKYCQARSWAPLVVTRPDKLDLCQYLQQQKIETCLVQSTREWPESILRCQDMWHDWNLVFLPDIDFSPEGILDQMWQGAIDHQKEVDPNENLSLIAAVFPIQDSSVWGCIESTGAGFRIAEKPLFSNQAWGFLMFRKEFGAELFEKLLESNHDHKWKEFSTKVKYVRLNRFEDLTRENFDRLKK